MSRAARQENVRYQPPLDGVRALAVLAVLLFHAGVRQLPGGFLGVDAFFVLSGFLITSLLLGELRRTGKIALGAFWLRRARRLLPALLAMLIVVALFARTLAAGEELGLVRGDALAALAYVANWRMIYRGTDYFAQTSAPSPLQHTWSLGIEEQFYLCWPVLVIALIVFAPRLVPGARSRPQHEPQPSPQNGPQPSPQHEPQPSPQNGAQPRRLPSPQGRTRPGSADRGQRIGRGVLLALVLVGALVSAVVAAVLYRGDDIGRAYFGTDTRAQALLVGCALALALNARVPNAATAPPTVWRTTAAGQRSRRISGVAAALGLMITGFLWAYADG
ncbi:MAG: acyltransferase family protein, partial [Hamadaea sp.]|nr:acyltransferase family protein [Hamadaea sp.]